MDLSTIIAAPRDVQIKHPATGEPIGLIVTLLPDEDPRIKAVQRKRMDAHLNRRQKFNAAQMEAFSTELTVVATTGWQWVDDADGVPGSIAGEQPEFSEANLRKLIKNHPFVRKQIDEELASEADFYTS